MQMVLKCADIGHLAAATHTHKRWAGLLEEEFFRQVGSLLLSTYPLGALTELMQQEQHAVVAGSIDGPGGLKSALPREA